MENKNKVAQDEEEEKRYTIRMPLEVYKRLLEESRNRDRSLHQQIIYTLRVGLGMVDNGKK